MAKMGIYFFCFTTVTQDQIGKSVCCTSKKQGQIGHLPPSNLINMKRMQFKNPITESISFKILSISNMKLKNRFTH